MKHISIIVYEDVLLTALSSSLSLLASANEAVARRGKPAPFQIELVGVHLKKYTIEYARAVLLQ